MNIEKQIIDQRINKIIQDNADLFTEEDLEKKRSKAFLLLGVAAGHRYRRSGADGYGWRKRWGI